MATITIRGKSGATKDIEADFFGPLAVHPSWGTLGLTITHVSTGARLPVLSDAEKAVKACADDLAKSFDWGFSEMSDARGLKDKVIPVLKSWGVYEFSDFRD